MTFPPAATAARRLTVVGVILMLAACSGSIYHFKRLPYKKAAILTVDARQRAILTAPSQDRLAAKSGGLGYVNAYERFCAEASPDVFSVLSQAVSGSGTFGKSADPATLNVALQGAFSQSETGSTIPRTQTVNMLREMMYRTCERYISGALTETEFPIQAARDQRVMVSILAIEQLTGAVTPKPVVISASSIASQGLSATDVVVRIDDAWKAYQSSQVEVGKRQEDFNAADSASGKDTCKTLKTRADAKDPPLTSDEVTKLDTCVTTGSQLATATTKQSDARAHYDTLVKASAGLSAPSTASATGQLLSNQEGSDVARATAAAEVASAVTDIVSHTFDQDETSFFCYKMLDPHYVESFTASLTKAKAAGAFNQGSKSNGSSGDIYTACLQRITTQQDSAAAALQESAARSRAQAAKSDLEAKRATLELDEYSKSVFDLLMNKISSSTDGVDSAKLNALVDALPIAQRLRCPAKSGVGIAICGLRSAGTVAEVKKFFDSLPVGQQSELAK